MDRKEHAVELKHNGYNCCQAVLCAFADKLPMSEDDLKRIGAAYGVGMGCMEATCGASICKDLKGRDTGVVLCECDDCVRNAVGLMDV